MRLRGVAAMALLVSACTTKADAPAVESPPNSSPEAGGAAHVNMIRLDTARSQPAAAPIPKASPRVGKDTGVVLRDSASGPRMEIDASGKVRPIKK